MAQLWSNGNVDVRRVCRRGLTGRDAAAAYRGQGHRPSPQLIEATVGVVGRVVVLTFGILAA